MRFCFLILTFTIILLVYSGNRVDAIEELEPFKVCPLCTMDGIITCPNGFEAACADKIPGDTQPRCLFLENKYIPGCWKFAGIKHLDFSLLPINAPPSTMINITGGGEVYTLNRDIVGCKKL